MLLQAGIVSCATAGAMSYVIAGAFSWVTAGAVTAQSLPYLLASTAGTAAQLATHVGIHRRTFAHLTQLHF